MMNRAGGGVLESSPVQQLVAAGNPNWWSGVRSPPPPPPPLMGNQPPQFLPSPTSSSSSSSPSLPNHNPNISSWSEYYDLLPESWSLSQLLLGGLIMGEEERVEMMRNQHSFQGKTLENREDQMLQASMGFHETNNNGYVMYSSHSLHNNNNNNSKSCVTTNTTTSLNSSGNNDNSLDFSTNHNHVPDRSFESHSSETGGSSANKKPRLQASPTQSTLKVRKEKLGGRIAALHQLVSPFGKTDTASVLSEAIGYIRFLQSQIEALSLPYFGTASGNMRNQHVQGERICIFPEDPGQLVNEQCMRRSRGALSSSSDDRQNPNNNKEEEEEEAKKDLRSRGLCLVPISCTLRVGSNVGADYWAPPQFR